MIVINTCSVRERAEEKLFTRLGEIRQLALETGLASGRRGGRLRGAAGRRAHPPALDSRRRRRRHPEHQAAADAREPGRVDAPRRAATIDLDPLDDVSFPLGIARRSDPLKAYVTIIEGCNEFCAFCVVPYTRGHERMRPVAEILAEARHAVATGAREIQLLGQIVNHYQAPDDPSCDFAALLERLQRASRGSSGSASRARTRGTSRRG